MSMKNSNDTNWDRTSDLPICSTVLPRSPFCKILWKNTVEPGKPQTAIWRMHCILYTWGYKRKPRICNTYYTSTATVVARRRLSVRLHVRCLSCWILTTCRAFCFDVSDKLTVSIFTVTDISLSSNLTKFIQYDYAGGRLLRSVRKILSLHTF